MTEYIESFLPQWHNRTLSKVTFSRFEDDVFTKAATYLSDYFPFGGVGFLCSDAEWAGLPGNTVNGNLVHPKPTMPPIPADVAASDNSAADLRRYEFERSEKKRLDAVRKDITNFCRQVQQFLLNPDVGGESHSVAVGDLDIFARMGELPDAPYGRLKAHLGTPDLSTFEFWSLVYTTRADNIAVTEWMRQDAYANTLLTAHNRQLSENQRLAAFKLCYEHSIPVMKCLERYRIANPVLANQNLANALAYIRTQEPIILDEMKKADLGYGPLAAIAESSQAEEVPDRGEQPFAAAAGQMYTQMQLDQAIAEALSQHTPVRELRQPREQKYCWLHGYQWSHTGEQCRSIEAGAKLRSFRDTRPQLRDNTIVFSHQGCRHSPKCITVKEAQEATGPTSRTHAAGNAMRSTDR